MMPRVRTSNRGTDRPVANRQHIAPVTQARATLTAASTLKATIVIQNSTAGATTAIERLTSVRVSMALTCGTAAAGITASGSGSARSAVIRRTRPRLPAVGCLVVHERDGHASFGARNLST